MPLPSQGTERELDPVASDDVEGAFEQAFEQIKVAKKLPSLTHVPPAPFACQSEKYSSPKRTYYY